MRCGHSAAMLSCSLKRSSVATSRIKTASPFSRTWWRMVLLSVSFGGGPTRRWIARIGRSAVGIGGDDHAAFRLGEELHQAAEGAAGHLVELASPVQRPIETSKHVLERPAGRRERSARWNELSSPIVWRMLRADLLVLRGAPGTCNGRPSHDRRPGYGRHRGDARPSAPRLLRPLR